MVELASKRSSASQNCESAYGGDAMSLSAKWEGLRSFENGLQALGQDRARKVIVSTLNDTIKRGKTLSARATVAKYNLRYGTMLHSMSGSISGTTGQIVARSPEIPSIQYKPKPGTPQPRRHPVININVVKRMSTPWPSAFVAKLKSGHLGVFTRTGASRLPIVERKSIGPGQEFLSHRRGLDVTIPNAVADYYNSRLPSKIFAALTGAYKG
jgi:hypothetical protein